MIKLIKDLGTRFPKASSSRKYRYGLYECPKCKVHFETQTADVKRGKSQSCQQCKLLTHGESKTKLYSIWKQMRNRCNMESHNSYDSYGGRGIKVCNEWNEYDSFKEWSLLNGYSDELSIDRIDNDGNYEPNNCRWTTRLIQAQNRGVFKNNTSGLTGVAKHKGKFIARITSDYKKVHIGIFDSEEEASIARDAYIHVNGLEHPTTHKFKRIEIGA